VTSQWSVGSGHKDGRQDGRQDETTFRKQTRLKHGNIEAAPDQKKKKEKKPNVETTGWPVSARRECCGINSCTQNTEQKLPTRYNQRKTLSSLASAACWSRRFAMAQPHSPLPRFHQDARYIVQPRTPKASVSNDSVARLGSWPLCAPLGSFGEDVLTTRRQGSDWFMP